MVKIERGVDTQLPPDPPSLEDIVKEARVFFYLYVLKAEPLDRSPEERFNTLRTNLQHWEQALLGQNKESILTQQIVRQLRVDYPHYSAADVQQLINELERLNQSPDKIE